MEEIYLPEKNMGNYNLHNAKRAKQDEFYTQLEDIEKELRHYDFKGKKVYCNCDNPSMSNFYKYFKLNFNYLGIKELISTGYNFDGQGYYGHYDGVTETIKNLEGNGDFRSEECIQFLKESDIVVTNPPFSLFREYVAQLMEYGKKFIILGNNNAITYKEIFPYIKNNELWLGRTLFTGKMPFFKVPNDYPVENTRFEQRADGLYKQVNAICWFTNVPNDSNREQLITNCRYSTEDYPKYDNYDAIECGRMEKLPMDYKGVIGIPITGLKYLHNDGYLHIEIDGKDTQFEIIWQASGNTKASTPKDILAKLNYIPHKDDRGGCTVVNGKRTYGRILIKILL